MQKKLFFILLRLTALAVFLALMPSCSGWSPSITRRELLQEAVQSFHITLITQNVPALLPYLAPESRKEWDASFNCLFKKVRIDDYSIKMVQTEKDLKEARAYVSIMAHRLNALNIQEFSLVENWIYKDKVWYVDSDPMAFKALFQDCFSAAQDS